MRPLFKKKKQMAANQTGQASSPKRKAFSADTLQQQQLKRQKSEAEEEPLTLSWYEHSPTSGATDIPALYLPNNQEAITVSVSGQPGRVVKIRTPTSPTALRLLNIRSESEAVPVVQLNQLPSSLRHFCCENVDVVASGNIFEACNGLKTVRVVDSSYRARDERADAKLPDGQTRAFRNAHDFLDAIPNKPGLVALHLNRAFGVGFSGDVLLQFTSLQQLNLGNYFDLPLRKLPTGLRQLHIGYGFSTDLGGVERLEQLEELKVGDMLGDLFDDTLEPLRKLQKLCKLVLGYSFNRVLDPLSQSKNLTELVLGHDFDQSLQPLSGLKNLSKLVLGSSFNRVLDPLSQSKNLTELVLGDEFDQSLQPLSGLKNLSKLVLGFKFNQTLGPLEGLQDLTELVLGDYFNQTLTPLHELKKLVRLVLGYSFNRVLDPLFELQNLAELVVGDTFNKEVSPLRNLRNLKKLVLGHSFNSPLEPLRGLERLEELHLEGANFNQPLEALGSVSALVDLRLGPGFRQSLSPLTGNRKLKQVRITFPHEALDLQNLPGVTVTVRDTLAHHFEKIRELRKKTKRTSPALTEQDLRDNRLFIQLFGRHAYTEDVCRFLVSERSANTCSWHQTIIWRTGRFRTQLHLGKPEQVEVDFDCTTFQKFVQTECPEEDKLIVVPVVIEFESDPAHSNLVVIDKRSKKIEHYEPHGSALPGTGAPKVEYLRFVSDTKTMFGSVFSQFEYQSPHNVCPEFPFGERCAAAAGVRDGLQAIQCSVGNRKDPISGSCNAWMLAYLRARIKEGAGAKASRVRLQHMSEVVGGDLTLSEPCQAELLAGGENQQHPLSLLEQACHQKQVGDNLYSVCKKHCHVWDGILDNLEQKLLVLTQSMLKEIGAVIVRGQYKLVFRLKPHIFYHSGDRTSLLSIMAGMEEWEKKYWYLDPNFYTMVFSGSNRLLLETA